MIRIRGVRKSFESQLVLDGVDLDIPERSVVSIIGPSGSGKSTLLRTIDFLETANAGTIDFGEGPVSLTSTKPKDIASVRAKIGFVFQNYNLFLNRTVLDNVAIGLIHAKGKGRKEAVRIAYDELDRVGMAGFADRYPSKLSFRSLDLPHADPRTVRDPMIPPPASLSRSRRTVRSCSARKARMHRSRTTIPTII